MGVKPQTQAQSFSTPTLPTPNRSHPMVQTIENPQTRTAAPTEILPIVLRLSPLIELTEEQFA